MKLEVFLQSKEKDKDSKYEMPESLGTLTFPVKHIFLLFVLLLLFPALTCFVSLIQPLSVMPVDLLTGVYNLSKEGVDTPTSVTLQLAIKPHEPVSLFVFFFFFLFCFSPNFFFPSLCSG